MPYKMRPSILESDNHSQIISFNFLLWEISAWLSRVKETRDFYKPLVISFITRSIFILPSCQNRHRTHHKILPYTHNTLKFLNIFSGITSENCRTCNNDIGTCFKNRCQIVNINSAIDLDIIWKIQLIS